MSEDEQPGDKAERSPGRLLRELFSPRLSETGATALLPTLYVIVGVLTVLAIAGAGVVAFDRFGVIGAVVAAVLGPPAGLVWLAAMRVLLTFASVVLRLPGEMRALDTRMNEVVHELRSADQRLRRMDDNLAALNRRITVIHQDFPRLAFWRRSAGRRDQEES